MKKNFITYLLMLVSLLPLPLATPAIAEVDPLEKPKNFINTNAQNVLNILKNGESKQAEEKRLTEVFLGVVDYNWMAQFTIGKYWNKLSAEQRTQYQEVYKKYLSSIYVSKYTEYNKQTYTLTDAKKMQNDQYMVFMEISSSNMEPLVKVAYRIREYNSTFKIIDIVAENISLINTQRAEFSSFLSRHSLEDLIRDLASKSM